MAEMSEMSEKYRTPHEASAGWLAEGVRSAVLLRARLDGLRASPWAIGVLMALLIGLGLLLQRGSHAGPVAFYWQAITSGWLSTVLLLWACWLVARSAGHAPDTATLFGVLVVQQIVISAPLWGGYLLIPHLAALWPVPAWAWVWVQWAVPFVVVGWVALAGAVLLLRHAGSGALPRVGVVLAFALVGALDLIAPLQQFWYPDESAASASRIERKTLHLKQEVMELQSETLIGALNAMQPQRAGVADVYAITFAPYAAEDVFRRESQLVTELMQTRFEAQGRTIQLINHAETAGLLPWATGLNLRRAIQRAASLMDRDEDVLFIHLTSHGGQNGQLAANFWPLEVESISPTQLRAWLDESGIRHRVISVSACYAGTWVPPLAEPGTLVMTASDAEHTSYGCGHKSELTFFGRAMYGEQLHQTRSFEVAHAAARQVIEKREQEAGKTDGYSNPQIAMGEAIRPKLAALAARLDAASLQSGPTTSPPVARE